MTREQSVTSGNQQTHALPRVKETVKSSWNVPAIPAATTHDAAIRIQTVLLTLAYTAVNAYKGMLVAPVATVTSMWTSVPPPRVEMVRRVQIAQRTAAFQLMAIAARAWTVTQAEAANTGQW